jgi:hypothetical protein
MTVRGAGYFHCRFIFEYDFLVTVDFFFGREIRRFFLALMLLTREFVTPSLFFFAAGFFAPDFLVVDLCAPLRAFRGVDGFFFATFFAIAFEFGLLLKRKCHGWRFNPQSTMAFPFISVGLMQREYKPLRRTHLQYSIFITFITQYLLFIEASISYFGVCYLFLLDSTTIKQQGSSTHCDIPA